MISCAAWQNWATMHRTKYRKDGRFLPQDTDKIVQMGAVSDMRQEFLLELATKSPADLHPISNR
jgi:hypothetical protein